MANKKLHNDQNDPIDKLFRDGLENREFVYDEKYWEEAEKTLSDYNSSLARKRNRGWGWWMGGAALLVIAVIYWLMTGERNSDQYLADEQVKTEQPAGQPNEASEATQPTAENNNASNKNPIESTTAKTYTSTNTTKPDLTGYTKRTPIAHSSLNSESADENNAGELPAKTGNGSINDSEETAQENNAEVPDATIGVKDLATEDTISYIPNFITTTVPPISRPAIEPVDSNMAKFVWFGGVYAGAQHCYPTISGSNILWNKFRGSNAKQAFSPIIGAEAGIEFADESFTISSGFQYMVLGEDVIYQINLTDIDTTFTYIYDDTTGYIIDTIMVINETDTVLMQSALNRLSYTEIPLMFGYTYHLDNWHFSFATGPSIGILQKKIGYYPNDALTGFEDVGELDYFKPITWFWKAEPTIGYSLDEHVTLQLRASFRWQLTNSYAADDRSLKYWSRGLKLGLQYTFH